MVATRNLPGLAGKKLSPALPQVFVLTKWAQIHLQNRATSWANPEALRSKYTEGSHIIFRILEFKKKTAPTHPLPRSRLVVAFGDSDVYKKFSELSCSKPRTRGLGSKEDAEVCFSY